MVKYTQTIRWQFADEFFECVLPFCGIGAVKVYLISRIKIPFYQSKLQGFESEGGEWGEWGEWPSGLRR